MTWTNPLKARWAAGETTFGLWCTTANPGQAEYAAHGSVDWILWDQQHGQVTDADLAGVFRACLGTSAVPLVRVAANDLTMIGRALDQGAAGVIVPLVNTAEEAARAAAACRYMPSGERSFGPNRATLVMGGLDPRIVEDVACVVMIETRQGHRQRGGDRGDARCRLRADRAERSRARAGSGVRRSRADAPGCRPADPRCVRRPPGSRPGIVLGSGEAARRYARMGFKFMNVAADVGLIVDGLERELAVARGG